MGETPKTALSRNPTYSFLLFLLALDSFKQINPTCAGGLGEAHVPHWGVQGGKTPLS